MIRVGLDPHEIEELARPEQNKIKISRRDFPYAISQKLSGGTTVSGTMIIAHKAGIPIFVTGMQIFLVFLQVPITVLCQNIFKY